MQTFKVDFAPNPIQKAFIESRAEADFFSSRFGEGKTAALCWCTFFHTMQNPGADWAMIRDTWDNLKATTLEEFFSWFPPGVFGSWSATDKTFQWTVEGMGGGKVQFMGMDDPKDAAKLQSRALAGAGFDEAAPAERSGGIAEAIFDVALGRMRQPNMEYYSLKLTANNPDESHWLYKRFVNPGSDTFRLWQPIEPENVKNLPPGYYEKLRRQWEHRPDFIRRFVDGQFGFQQQGIQVTPEWDDHRHLANGLYPIRGTDLILLWDFGHNPTCIITQRLQNRHWNILEAFVGEEMGVEELIETEVKPALVDRYKKFSWRHIGAPAGNIREPPSIQRSAVKMIRTRLGGSWKSGPVKWPNRREPLRAILRQNIGPRGLIQVDRVRAKAVRNALRGGWHYHVAHTGLTGAIPKKDIHSHPGDALSYGAAVLFPLGKPIERKAGLVKPRTASFFDKGQLGMERPGLILPPEARRIG